MEKYQPGPEDMSNPETQMGAEVVKAAVQTNDLLNLIAVVNIAGVGGFETIQNRK
ncbi:hypothetical protein HN803_01010 [candidate division WWE3 bacterium]|jgi:hypothetical protein|nr:hypothetical protein [candidate division WWE3 bacterium]MBT7349354.1 hypothetical protein [candidate division WWE3 bacterium]